MLLGATLAIGLAGFWGEFPALLVGTTLLGFGSASTQLARYAAADMAAPEGRAKATPLLGRMGADGRVFVTPDFADVETAARVTVFDPAGLSAAGRRLLALAVVGEMARRLGLVPPEALVAAADLEPA